MHAQLNDAVETLGNLVSRAGGEGDEALSVVKDALAERDRLVRGIEQVIAATDDEWTRNALLLLEAVTDFQGRN